MIHCFRFRNVLSYREGEIDFYASGRRENSLPSGFAPGICPVAAIFGNNASGKSNFIEAFRLFRELVVSSFKEGRLYYLPHVLLHGEDSLFEIEAEINGQLYRYHLRYNEKEVTDEVLLVRKVGKRFRRIFLRQGNQLKIGEGFRQAFPLKKKLVASGYVALPYLYHSGFEPVQPLFDFLKEITVYLPGRGEGKGFLESALRELHRADPGLLQFVKRILEIADVGIKDFLFSQEKKAFQGLEFVHAFTRKEARLSLAEESTGTVILFLLSPHLYRILQRGSLMVLDQVDGNIHPWTWEKILNFFRSPARNVAQAQLLFSTHCPSVMDCLRKEELWLVEKRDGFSEIYSAKDFVDLKKGEDLRRLYLSGKLGAVPGG